MGGIWLCKAVVGCGEGVAEQLRKLITKLLVEGAGKEEVGDIFSGGIAEGTVSGQWVDSGWYIEGQGAAAQQALHGPRQPACAARTLDIGLILVTEGPASLLQAWRLPVARRKKPAPQAV